MPHRVGRSWRSTPQKSGVVDQQPPDPRWATDLIRLWRGRDRWCSLALVRDCAAHGRWGAGVLPRGAMRPRRGGPDQAFRAPGPDKGDVPALRPDNGLAFSSRRYPDPLEVYGLRQEFITPHQARRAAGSV